MRGCRRRVPASKQKPDNHGDQLTLTAFSQRGPALTSWWRGTVWRVSEAGGGDLFIVDNSVSGWTGLEYLRQWTDVARSFDVATGFFEIGALLALDGKWQQLEGIRLLMGDEVSLRTHNVFKDALRRRVGRLDDSLEREKGPEPLP